MPRPPLKLPADPFGLVFRIHADALRNNSLIRQLGGTVVVQDGDENKESDMRMPAVKLTAATLDNPIYVAEGVERILEVTMRLQIEIVVEGSLFEDVSRLGFAVLNAWFPEDTNTRQGMENYLANSGMQSRTIIQPFFGGNAKGSMDCVIAVRL